MAQLGNDLPPAKSATLRPGEPGAAVGLAVERFGRLDGLYHVAGGSGRSAGDGALHEVSDTGIDQTIDHNLKSLIYSNRAAVQQFLKQGGGGAILNMGSVLGYSPSPEFFASHVYAATKSAAIGFTKSIAAHYARHGHPREPHRPCVGRLPDVERRRW